ncbi:uncharacterized protein TM35_000053100 [Trypanosoma theileri]|uniref:Uncharacterized protein n=1 Tax=Trypanosoma theileri TaxID=67003 RepID=A0A1X0P450_9TRYP|nr:uncharacterized protein TM35_000053100 [Trypanosoma theileri]ORC91714.1 hypothetical protein TM35_000053100 [Trypanosoma theileri]
METTDLVKTLLKSEEDCRALREELATLEKTRRLKERGEMSISDDAINSSAISKSSKSRTLTLPIEAVGDLNSKAGELSLVVKNHKKLLRERKQLENILEGSIEQTAEAKEENEALKNTIGFSEGATLANLRDATDAIAAKNKLKHDILNALSDREVIKLTLKRQTENIKSLTEELLASKSWEEQRADAAEQLENKKTELNKLREEVQSMQRLLGRKDKQLDNKKPVDELALAKSAENDRRVVLHKLDKEQEYVRLNDMAIRHRALQIAKLEKRIEMIGDAVGGKDSDDDDERVDIELLEQLRKEILSLGRLHIEANARLEALDADVADLDRRSTGLVRTTANVRKEMSRIEREHRKFVNAQKKEVEVEQAAVDYEIKLIEKEIEMLRQVNSRNGQRVVRQ